MELTSFTHLCKKKPTQIYRVLRLYAITVIVQKPGCSSNKNL